MSVIGKRVIYVGPADGGHGKPLHAEGVLRNTTALPGTMLESEPLGFRVNQKPSTSFFRELIVADKDQLKSKSVDDAWLEDESIVAIRLRSGEFANVMVAAGNDITELGAPLSLNGSGILQLANVPATIGATSDWVIAHADEVINTGATDQLVRIRVV